MKEKKITTENACSWEVFSQTITYFLSPELFDGKEVKLSLIRRTENLREEKNEDEVMFTKSFEEFPIEWMEGAKMSISFQVHEGKMYTNQKLHPLKKVYKTKKLHPLFGDDGKCYGSDEVFTRTEYVRDVKTKEKSSKTATYTLEERPEALTWLIMVQGDVKHSERKLLSQEGKNKIGKGDYERELWTVPVYVNGHLAGARIMSENYSGGGCVNIFGSISAEELAALD